MTANGWADPGSASGSSGAAELRSLVVLVTGKTVKRFGQFGFGFWVLGFGFGFGFGFWFWFGFWCVFCLVCLAF